MKKMDLQQKYSFEILNDRILHMIENNYYLEYPELYHMYTNMAYRTKRSYQNLCQSIIYLLETMQNEELNALVQLLNTDFEYCPNWKIDINTLEDRFNTWTYTCKKPETRKFLNSLAIDIKKQKENASLNMLKSILDKGKDGKE